MAGFPNGSLVGGMPAASNSAAARRMGLRRGGQCLDLVQSLRENGSQVATFVAAGFDEVHQAIIGHSEDRGM